jgi:hypothetical protein
LRSISRHSSTGMAAVRLQQVLSHLKPGIRPQREGQERKASYQTLARYSVENNAHASKLRPCACTRTRVSIPRCALAPGGLVSLRPGRCARTCITASWVDPRASSSSSVLVITACARFSFHTIAVPHPAAGRRFEEFPYVPDTVPLKCLAWNSACARCSI